LAKKKASSNSRFISSIRNVSIEDLAQFVTLWNYVSVHPVANYSQAWESLQLPGNKKVGSEKVKKITTMLDRGLFFRKVEGELVAIQDQKRFIDELNKLLLLIDKQSVSLERPKIRFGVGHSVALSIAPAILDRIRSSDSDFEVNFVIGDTDRLVFDLKKGELDCVLGVLPPDFVNEQETVADHRISPALIARNSHPIARKFRELRCTSVKPTLFEDIRQGKWGVHVFDSAALHAPRSLLANCSNIRFLSQPNYAAINEIVVNGSDLGISFPQLLTPSQLMNCQSMALDLKEKDSPRLQLLSCKQLCTSRFDSMNSLTQGEFGVLLQRLVDESASFIEDHLKRDFFSSSNLKFRIFARAMMPGVRKSVAGGSPNSGWIEGTLFVHSKTEQEITGEIRLHHSITDGSKKAKPLTYSRLLAVQGSRQSIRNDRQLKELWIVQARDGGWEPFICGDKEQRNSQGELFTASFVRKSNQEVYFGKWQGWDWNKGIPAIGDLIVEDPLHPIQKVTSVVLDDLYRNSVFINNSVSSPD